MALQQEWEVQGNFLFRYRSHLPLLLLPVAAWVMSYMVIRRPEWFLPHGISALELVSLICSLSGLLIRILTVGYTPKNTSGRNTAQGQVADTLNTSGIYSVVRHPLYLGNYFMWLGVAILTGDLWFWFSFSLLYALYYERIMYAEEQFLTKKFGETYLSWASVTPAFIPAFRVWRGPELRFSWKKVLKKEKNGLFAIFLLLWMFQCWQEFLQTGQWMAEKKWSFSLMIASGIVYFALKWIKMSSRWLEEEGR
ncbi:MAG: isoprenylcysteine carboxylmethyltransferase family protein [Saprospiraceae bacterium]|jgi:protein-S-isoprenylcysteine O-methyltransferase Ste14|nr:isoprenylcysteine carboxylmethyltransferase family protein [Saprospiraceae bacterium]